LNKRYWFFSLRGKRIKIFLFRYRASKTVRNERSGITANACRRLGTCGAQDRDGWYFYQYLTQKKGLIY